MKRKGKESEKNYSTFWDALRSTLEKTRPRNHNFDWATGVPLRYFNPLPLSLKDRELVRLNKNCVISHSAEIRNRGRYFLLRRRHKALTGEENYELFRKGKPPRDPKQE